MSCATAIVLLLRSKVRTTARACNNFECEVKGVDNLQAEYEALYGPGDYIPLMVVTYWTFRFMEDLPDKKPPIAFPDSSFMVPKMVLVHDSFRQTVTVPRCRISWRRTSEVECTQGSSLEQQPPVNSGLANWSLTCITG